MLGGDNIRDKEYDLKKGAKNKKPYSSSAFEQDAVSISSLGREELTRRIKDFRGKFKMDFTEDHLNGLSVDRLRHIYLAALINNPNNSNDLESRAD